MPMTGLGEGRQLWLLLYSCGLGAALGLLFEAFGVAVRFARRRRAVVFFIDVFYLVFSALATFYFSLAVMDGMMHPLLFGGCLLGFYLEHVTLGRLIGKLLYQIIRYIRFGFAWVFRLISAPLYRLCDRLYGDFSVFSKKIAKKEPKARKKCIFFRKKT